MNTVRVRPTTVYDGVIWSGSLVEAAEICAWVNHYDAFEATARFDPKYQQIVIDSKEWDEYSCPFRINAGDGVREADNEHPPMLSPLYSRSKSWEVIE